MAASLHRLRPKREKAEEAQADLLRDLLASVPGLPQREVARLRVALDAQTPSSSGWTFLMLSPAQNNAVVKWLRGHSRQPVLALALWAELFEHLDRHTGRIAATRDELAEAVGTSPREVSRIMGELEEVGAVSRQREKVPGLQGPGMAAYFMNPKVATHLPGAARDKAQEAAPQLRLVP